MKSPTILMKYLSRAFAFSLIISLIVLSFIMSLGVLFEVTNLLAKGAALSSVCRIFMNGIPAAMMFTIPMSTLVASLLLFGRLSADGEITAMRVSGLSFSQIMRGPLLVSGVTTLICFYVNCFLAPRCHYQQRSSIRNLASQSPMELIEVGHYIETFPGVSMYIGSKENGVLKQVRIRREIENGKWQETFAEESRIRVEENKKDIIFDLTNVTIDPNPVSDQLPPAHYAAQPIKIVNALGSGSYKLKPTDYSIIQLIQKIARLRDKYDEEPSKELLIERTRYTLEFHKRWVLSLSSFSFAFLGIPLGVRSHRKESSIGVAISLILVVNFYLFIMIAESLVKIPGSHPAIIMWLPVVLSLSVGAWLIKRAR